MWSDRLGSAGRGWSTAIAPCSSVASAANLLGLLVARGFPLVEASGLSDMAMLLRAERASSTRGLWPVARGAGLTDLEEQEKVGRRALAASFVNPPHQFPLHRLDTIASAGPVRPDARVAALAKVSTSLPESAMSDSEEEEEVEVQEPFVHECDEPVPVKARTPRDRDSSRRGKNLLCAAPPAAPEPLIPRHDSTKDFYVSRVRRRTSGASPAGAPPRQLHGWLPLSRSTSSSSSSGRRGFGRCVYHCIVLCAHRAG